MINILKNKKGMTLTELIVGIILFAIITATVSAIMVPMLMTYEKANEFAECNTLLDNVANQIVNDLANATIPLELDNLDGKNKISITIDSPDEVIYTIDDSSGVLLKNGTSVLSKTYYKNKSVNFTCTPTASGSGIAYTLTVIILSDKNGEMIRRDYAVKPLVLNQY